MRRQWTYPLLAVLLCLAAVPAGAEEHRLEDRVDLCIITYRPSADFGTLLVEADQEMSDEEMAELLDEVDADDSGAIDAAEVRAYEDDSERNETDTRGMGVLTLVLDGLYPSQVRFRTVLHGFEGPIDEDKNRLVTEHREYHFPETSGDSRLLEGGDAQAERNYTAVIEFVVFEAPAEWLVGSVNGERHDEARVSFEAFDTKGAFSVAFTRVPEEVLVSIPAPPLASTALAVVALASIAAFWRPKR